jgi:hypothetical protein
LRHADRLNRILNKTGVGFNGVQAKSLNFSVALGVHASVSGEGGLFDQQWTFAENTGVPRNQRVYVKEFSTIASLSQGIVAYKSGIR